MPQDDQVSQETQGEGDERIVRLDRVVLRVLLLCVILLVGLHLLVHNLPWAPQFAAPDSQVRLFFDLASEPISGPGSTSPSWPQAASCTWLLGSWLGPPAPVRRGHGW